MSAVVEPIATEATALALLGAAEADRIVAWRDGRAVSAAEFLADVATAAAALPAAAAAINLCEDRYEFLVAFCAVAAREQINLLPPSRAEHAVDEALDAYAGSYPLSDVLLAPTPKRFVQLASERDRVAPLHGAELAVDSRRIAAIGFTSGSTGQPKPNPKSWAALAASSARNSEVLVDALALLPGASAHIVATVPPQHMYGIEMSILLPLFGPFSVHSGRPLFPADVTRALEDIPEPRVLVTTPIHLRALLRDPQALPRLGAIASATAPLPAELAEAAEARYGAPVVEFFGSTETCVIGHRRTARESDWKLYADVRLQPQPDGTLVDAPYFEQPVVLPDLIECRADGRFALRGRHADLVDIAGKRASLADLTRRVLALAGVEDAIVFQLEASHAGAVARIAALVVAPQRSEADLLDALRAAIDPAFLPRPLRKVAALPRNETGKLPRERLLEALRGS